MIKALNCIFCNSLSGLYYRKEQKIPKGQPNQYEKYDYAVILECKFCKRTMMCFKEDYFEYRGMK